jgi:hypothetical protein
MVSNVFIEHFAEIALDTAGHKPSKLFGYVDDTVVWSHGLARLRNFFTTSTVIDLLSNSQSWS